MFVHRIAWIALISVIVLVVVGATVRVTGSGLGCPDWPTCWGCLIPPTSADQIDVDKLDLEKFRRHAIRKGIDPATITRATVLDSFDPVHTWIEFVNRLTSLPLGLSTLVLALASFTAKRKRGWVVGLSWFCLIDVLANAIMGAIVVRSGLQPGIITLHMALAFLLIAVLVTIIWMTRPQVSHLEIAPQLKRRLQVVSLVFFFCLFCEGLLGSQLREHTDELAHAVDALARDQWVEQLAETWIFKIHRSFSWTLLIASGLMVFWMRRAPTTNSPQPREPKLILGIVIAMMVMGIILGHIAVFQIVQVLHVGLTAVLLAITWHWIMRLVSGKPTSPQSPSP